MGAISSLNSFSSSSSTPATVSSSSSGSSSSSSSGPSGSSSSSSTLKAKIFTPLTAKTITTSRIPSAQSVFVSDISSYPQILEQSREKAHFYESKFNTNVLNNITSKTTPKQLNELMRQNSGCRLDHFAFGHTILSTTLRCKNLSLFYPILKSRPALINSTCYIMKSPLTYLSTIDDPWFCFEAARHLILQCNSDVNAKSGVDTPLFYFASHAKFKEITKLLLLNGAVTMQQSEADIQAVKKISPELAIRIKAQPKNIEEAIQELRIEVPVIEWIRDDETGVLSQLVKDVRLVVVEYFSGLI